MDACNPTECSIAECGAKTFNPFANRPPEKRWAVLKLKQDDGNEIIVTLCPKHVREILPVDNEFFERVENTEKFIRKEAIH